MTKSCFNNGRGNTSLKYFNYKTRGTRIYDAQSSRSAFSKHDALGDVNYTNYSNILFRLN